MTFPPSISVLLFFWNGNGFFERRKMVASSPLFSYCALRCYCLNVIYFGCSNRLSKQYVNAARHFSPQTLQQIQSQNGLRSLNSPNIVLRFITEERTIYKQTHNTHVIGLPLDRSTTKHRTQIDDATLATVATLLFKTHTFMYEMKSEILRIILFIGNPFISATQTRVEHSTRTHTFKNVKDASPLNDSVEIDDMHEFEYSFLRSLLYFVLYLHLSIPFWGLLIFVKRKRTDELTNDLRFTFGAKPSCISSEVLNVVSHPLWRFATCSPIH